MKPTIEELQGRIDVLSRKKGEFETALAKLFGVTHESKIVTDSRGFQRVIQRAALPEIALAFESLAEAFSTYTGGANPADFDRVRQIYGGPEFLSALGTVLNKLLLKDYPLGDYHWRDLVAQIDSVENFRPQDAVRLRYFSDLPEVGEDELYAEAIAHADEKVTFSVTTRGALLFVTRRAIMGTDVRGIQRAVEQIRRAAWRTLAKQVWAKLISNGTYGADGLALFHVDHGNLGSSALDVAALNAARAAIFAQKEPGADERMGLSGPFMLAVPIELEPTAFAIALCDQIGGSPNPWRGRFGPQGERVFANPLMVDAEDWILFDVSGNAGLIEIGFLGGRQEPLLTIADNPREGQAFTQDRVIYKTTQEYGLTIADYRGAYKAVVI